MNIKQLIKVTSIFVIFFISISPAAAWLSVTVTNPTINFGTVYADGNPVYAPSTITLNGNENFDFYVRANRPLTSANGSFIPNNPNFQFRIQYPPRSIDSEYVIFNGNNQKIVSNWPKPNTGGADAATGTYRLIVPPDTLGGNYTTTITFTVVSDGITPTNTEVMQMDSNLVNNSTGNITNDTNTTNSSMFGIEPINEFTTILLDLF